MQFHLTPEQIAIQDAVRGTLAETWGIDKLHALADADADFHRESWDALMGLGIGGLAVPEDHGGTGLGLLDAALVCEVVGEAAAPGPVIGQLLTAIAVAQADSEPARARLPEIVSGEAIATLALDGELVQSVRAASLLLADDGQGGLQLIEAGGGVTIEPVQPTDRSRKVSRAAFGPEAKAHSLCGGNDPLAQRIREAALVLIAADALGGAQRVTDMSVGYAK